MDELGREEPFLLFGQPLIGEEEIQEVVACLRSGWIGRGPRVTRFELQFAACQSVPEAVALQSCSSALLLALRAGGVGPGDEVITSPMTYCAAINAIIHSGARPVLADIAPHTLRLPLSPAWSSIEIDRVVHALRAILTQPAAFAFRAHSTRSSVNCSNRSTACNSHTSTYSVPNRRSCASRSASIPAAVIEPVPVDKVTNPRTPHNPSRIFS